MGCISLVISPAASLLDVEAVVHALLLAPRASQRCLGGCCEAANLRRPLGKLPNRASLDRAHEIAGSSGLSPKIEKHQTQQWPGDH